MTKLQVLGWIAYAAGAFFTVWIYALSSMERLLTPLGFRAKTQIFRGRTLAYRVLFLVCVIMTFTGAWRLSHRLWVGALVFAIWWYAVTRIVAGSARQRFGTLEHDAQDFLKHRWSWALGGYVLLQTADVLGSINYPA